VKDFPGAIRPVGVSRDWLNMGKNGARVEKTVAVVDDDESIRAI